MSKPKHFRELNRAGRLNGQTWLSSRLNGVAAGLQGTQRQGSEAWPARDLAGLWSIRPSLGQDCRWSNLSLSANDNPSMIHPSLNACPSPGITRCYQVPLTPNVSRREQLVCRTDLTKNTNPAPGPCPLHCTATKTQNPKCELRNKIIKYV